MQEDPKAAGARVVISVPKIAIGELLKLRRLAKTGCTAVVPILIYLSSSTKLLLIPLLGLEAFLIGAYIWHRNHFSNYITHMELTEDRKNAILRLGTAGPGEEFSVEVSSNKAINDRNPKIGLFSQVRYKGKTTQMILMSPTDFEKLHTDVTHYQLARHVMNGDLQQVEQYRFN